MKQETSNTDGYYHAGHRSDIRVFGRRAGRRPVVGVLHAERGQDCLPDILIQWFAGGDLDEIAEDIMRVAIDPFAAGLGSSSDRQSRQPL